VVTPAESRQRVARAPARSGYVQEGLRGIPSYTNGRNHAVDIEGRAQLAAQREQWQAVDGTLRGIWMQACAV
jgi:hypothetical protein